MAEKSELIPVLEQIERDKGIKKDDILHMIEQAVISAYKKHSGTDEANSRLGNSSDPIPGPRPQRMDNVDSTSKHCRVQGTSDNRRKPSRQTDKSRVESELGVW